MVTKVTVPRVVTDQKVVTSDIRPVIPARGSQGGWGESLKKRGTQIRKSGRFNAAAPIYADFEQGSHIGWVPIERLRVDHTYQRSLDQNRVRAMAHSWIQDRCGLLVVNQRADGDLYIIDGQQRQAALMLIDNRPREVLAEIFQGLTQAQEARLFFDLDTKRRGLTTAAIFHALVAAEDPAAIEILDIAEKAGLSLSINSSAPNNLRAFGTVMQIHRRAGPQVLARIFKIVTNSWSETKYWGAGSILHGLETFFRKYPDAKDAHLITTLQKVTPVQIETKARLLNDALTTQVVSHWVARVIHGLYNRGMKKYRLEDWDV